MMKTFTISNTGTYNKLSHSPEHSLNTLLNYLDGSKKQWEILAIQNTSWEHLMTVQRLEAPTPPPHYVVQI